LSGKTAVLIGASGGLGEAMAHSLADRGCALALVGRNKGKLDGLAAAVMERGVAAEVFTADVVREDDVARLREEVGRRFVARQILINSAGINIRKNLVDFTLDEFKSVVDSSLIST